MTRILYIEASPRGGDSKSTFLAETYLSALGDKNPDITVDRLNVWTSDLPPFDGDKVAAKMNVILGHEQSESQKTQWDQIVEIVSRFTSADRYLISSPMWNSGVPYRLKHYIDLIHQPGLLWNLTPEAGYIGQLRRKHATLILTAGAYAPDQPSPAFGIDHHSTYLRDWLTQAGVAEIDILNFQPTILSPTPTNDLRRAEKGAIDLAHQHGRI